MISAQKELPVEESIRSIFLYVDLQNSVQTFYTVYVVDKFKHLVGTEAVTHLLLTKKQPFISEMMNPYVIVLLMWIKKRYPRLLSNTTWFWRFH